MLFCIIVIPILWYLIGKIIIRILICEFNIKAFKEVCDDSGLIETGLAFIWPITIIMLLIDVINDEYNLD